MIRCTHCYHEVSVSRTEYDEERNRVIRRRYCKNCGACLITEEKITSMHQTIKYKRRGESNGKETRKAREEMAEVFGS